MTNPKLVKILVVAPALPLVGGQAVQAQRLIEKFRNHSQIKVDLQPINPVFFPSLQKIKYLRTILTTVKYLFDLLIKVPRYDVIHVFSASYLSFFLAPTPALIIAKLMRRKTILNYRSGEAKDHLTNSPVSIRIIRKFDKIITPSYYLVDVFAEFDLEAESIFNFVDGGKFTFRARNPLKPVFFSNRNFEELYNVGCILRAFAIIQNQYPKAELIIAGDGIEKEKLHQLAKDLRLENITFTGRISQNEMPEFYNRADIYLNSPNIDNMPNSVIEAFASGIVVVSTNAGGIPYIVTNNKNGILVDVDDHCALAEKAVYVLENSAFAEELIGDARRESEKYTWENVKDKWIKLYCELAGRK